ncbi:hypothetical protein BD779DRAFT_617777 [Infundibulicybe gibba]|nr:hypothetical protein BD779DRAFT_617777 [Infundibulicybe gibba]
MRFHQGAERLALLTHRPCLHHVRLLNCNLQYTVQKRIDSKTQVSFSPRIARQGQAGGCNFMGTVRHQFSPHIVFEGTYALLHPRIFNLNANYQDDNNSLSVRTSCIPSALGLAPPSLNVSINRKLFPRRFEQGSLNFAIGRQPHVSFNIISPTPFSFYTSPPADDVDHSNAPSISGLKVGATHKSVGFMLDFNDPKVVGEWGVTFTELALQMKVGLELGVTGLSWVVSGSWARESTELNVSAFINSLGVVLKLEASYLEQKLSLPIVLSQGYDSTVAFWAVVAPSTTLVLGYHFIIKPRRRARRLSFIRSARQALDEDSGERREREAVAALLKETARKHMETETSKGGLVILEATFGSIEVDEGAKDLAVDVTVPIQALVRHSQLYIAGHQTKSGIQGFSDPAPFATKSLNIRYLFRGRMHYAEIPDYLPVVLPLADHLVE